MIHKASYIILLSTYLHSTTFSQESYRSNKFGYTFEIPQGFKPKPSVIGKNIDLSVIDAKGCSINIVVKDIDAEYIGTFNVLDLNSVSIADWELSLSENMDNVHVIKKGTTVLNSYDAFYMRHSFYGHQEKTEYYTISYMVAKKNKTYTISFTSKASEFNSYYEAIIFRALHSFKF